ncbi:MAG: homocysteine S-methyltransferase family protein, partial [Chloroflexota bacterium]|nr:homocysteine S-methyltransferase family protein [Chloroflexota bacterium]
MITFQALLNESKYILADGAMGTVLFTAGLQHGDPPEKWTLEHPDRVAAAHRAYLEAGSQLLLTNTFGGNRLRLSLHGGLETRVEELNQTAAKILRSEVDASGGNALVAGDIGPTGQVMAPYGELAFEEAVEAFAEQAAALISGKVDLIWIETMAD